MKKLTALTLGIALSASLTAATLTAGTSNVKAAPVKEWVQISAGVTYYGEVGNGIPNGRGTIHWGEHKQYAGEFVNGKREGTGKYINEYAADGEQHKVVYNGAWKQDQMDGKGTLTHRVTEADGSVRSNEIQTGTFEGGLLQTGYDVIHALADPDFSFTYVSPQETLHIMGSNLDMKASFKKGQMFSADYTKGPIRKSTSIFPADTAADQRKNDADLKYLKSIQSHLNPYIEEFERLSKQVPLK